MGIRACIFIGVTAWAAALPGLGLAASVRGELLEPPEVLATLTVSAIDSATASANVQILTGKAKCDVTVVAINYRTVGVANEDTNASGVLLAPGGNCNQTPAALVAYAKGTDVEKLHTLANPADSQTMVLAAFFAAQGYAVVATDYLGFAKSSYPYHPYLHAESEATSVVDSVRAARNAAGVLGLTLSGTVALTGYSQGGHASMAAQRAVERDHAAEFSLLGGAHLAGPYNLSGALQSANANLGAQLFVPYAITSWQKVYGNIYRDVNEVFEMPYASYIESLLPSPTLSVSALTSTGKLPGANNETPDQALNLLLKPAYRADIQGNPNNPVLLAAKKNDLLDWTPRANVLLCGGAGDPTVQTGLHLKVMKAAFDSKGLTHVSSVDVDPTIKLIFSLVLAFSPDTYYAAYHSTLEPPFCLAQAKSFVDGLVQARSRISTDADTVFNWAQRTYSDYFASASDSASIAGYHYRSYADNTYLGVNETGEPHLFYIGPLSRYALQDLGLLSTFVAQAR